MLKLRPFQKRILGGGEVGGISNGRGLDTARQLEVVPGRGRMVVEVLVTPGSKLFVRGGTESVLRAANTLEQARIVYPVRQTDARRRRRLIDSPTAPTQSRSLHKPTNTKIRAHGSNAKIAMGLVGCANGRSPTNRPPGRSTRELMMVEAIQSSMGKPGSPLRACLHRDVGAGAAGRLVASADRVWHDRLHVRLLVAGRSGNLG